MNRLATVALPALALAAAAMLAGCTGKQEKTPAKRNAMSLNAIQDHSSNSPAEALFVEKCGMCHRQMGMGTVLLGRRMPAAQAMLETRRDLTRAFVKAAVRGGVGNMPPLSRGEVSDRQLDTIAGYLAKGGK